MRVGQSFTHAKTNKILKITEVNEQAVHATDGFNAYRVTFEKLVENGQITLLD